MWPESAEALNEQAEASRPAGRGRKAGRPRPQGRQAEAARPAGRGRQADRSRPAGRQAGAPRVVRPLQGVRTEVEVCAPRRAPQGVRTKVEVCTPRRAPQGVRTEVGVCAPRRAPQGVHTEVEVCARCPGGLVLGPKFPRAELRACTGPAMARWEDPIIPRSVPTATPQWSIERRLAALHGCA